MRDSAEWGPLDARVPGIATFWSCGAQAFAEGFQVVGDGHVSDEFDALISKLARDAHAQRAAVAYGKFTAIHAVDEKGLWVQGIGHIDAIPPVGLDGEVDDVAGVRLDADGIQDVMERHADPLGDVGPALFALHHGDLAASRVTFELCE